MGRHGLDAQRMESYLRSYHGLSVLKGSTDAATCNSCHETHAIKSSIDSASSVHANHLVETCAKCHNNVTKEFVKIDGGYLVMKDGTEVPVSTRKKQAVMEMISDM